MSITKEEIITAIRRIYDETGIVPKSNNYNLPCSNTTIYRKFGSWNEALIEAGLTPNVNKPLLVQCKNCNKEFLKLYNQVKKTNNHFCSKSCASTYNKSNRIVSDAQREKTSNTLKNKIIENKNNLTKKSNCKTCGNSYEKYKSEFCSKKCQKKGIDSICLICNKEFKGNRKTCSDACLLISQKKAGANSIQVQQKRSKGEILFYELCVAHFKNHEVLSNPQMFEDKNGNNWDCDIVIPDLKLCIAYNGIWHYEDLGGKHKLAQVQARDKIKEEVIKSCGYKLYIVKDLGKFNKDFVHAEFDKFIHQLESYE